ncbi:DUF2716 domain-containing protein [Planotetraspora mira]|uniref:DUF2716 domain-containing protein n=1 Tax=Planotetraspora mira TaxID=58121 RepID=A0A8J3TL72_9ACTN|nr:DUF2716 domain-containing protein [Planotetraspora mira]GII27812.1 hypothetical protein Pmi06nite_12540 [Planotetraspora mira]
MRRGDTPAAYLLATHDAQLRGRVPEDPPVGAVIEQDGPVVRTHYGTHGSVDHGDLTGVDIGALVRRQRDVFAERGEAARWTVHSHDSPSLDEHLRAEGFTRGWDRSVLVATLDTIPPPPRVPSHKRRVRPLSGDGREYEDVRRLAAEAGPQRTPLAELEADGLAWDMQVLVLEGRSGLLGAGWAEVVQDTEFVSLGGMTAPHPELVEGLAEWARQPKHRYAPSPARHPRYLIAEADGDHRTALREIGFCEITQATSYQWNPPVTPPATRPVTLLFGEPEHNEIWDAFEKRFAFKPSTTRYPGIAEPPVSATWDLTALKGERDTLVEAIQAIVERGLVACTRPGEFLYWLDWNHAGYRFDPHRVSGPGRPRWPGAVDPDGDYYLYLTSDLRLGTFGHPWEDTLCVFGEDLLAEVEMKLTEVLGPVLRRGGRTSGGG